MIALGSSSSSVDPVASCLLLVMCILYVQVASSDTVERQGEGGKEETGGKARVFMKILGDPEPEPEPEREARSEKRERG